MSDLLPTIAPYVPPPVLRAVLADPTLPKEPAAEQFEAAILFADVSGFTPLTEALGRKGAEGPEELTGLLNRYFSRMISLIEAEGGQVVKFGGDAVTVLFPATEESLDRATRRARQAADAMQAAMGDFATLQTSVGPVALGMKISIGAGEVLTMRIGGIADRWEYVIAGDPLRQIAEAEKRAQKGDVILSPEADRIVLTEPLPPRAIAQVDWSAVENLATVEPILRSYVPRAVQSWLGKDLHDWLAVLRPMSVLFIGVAGLDYGQPNAVERLHTFVRSAQETVFRYGGVLSRLSVDDKGMVMLVLFGPPPFAHEDDPLRAVRCALELQSLAPHDPFAPREGPESIGLSIGITTGHVFAGPVGGETRREYTVMGDTVNLAARLMGKAGVGGILCNDDTYRQSRHQIAFESLPPMQVKGKAAPVSVYRPTSATADRPPPSERRRDTFIGREAELARLESALTAVEDGASRIVIVEGSAGIGKSRLIAELAGAARERGLEILSGAGDSIEQRAPYRAWRDVFSTYFDLREVTDPTARQARVQSLLGQVAPEQAPRAPLLNDVINLGLPETDLTASLDPALRQQSLAALLVVLLRTRARKRPLFIVLEDAQWLDSLSWELAVYVARALIASDDPLLLVMATRPLDGPGVGGRYSESLRRMDCATVLPLAALDPEETVAVATARLGLPAGGVPDSVAELIRQRAGGNPFFAEELVFTLRDRDVIRIEPDTEYRGDPSQQPLHCVVQGDVVQASQALPDTLQGLILARIDQLPPACQLALKVAAVIGRTFGYATLLYTLQRHTAVTETALPTYLQELEALDIRPTETLEQRATYVFEHIVTREVSYQTLLFAQRRRLHHTVGEWYETTFAPMEWIDGSLKGYAPFATVPGDLAPYLPLLVHHFHHAEDVGRERLYAGLAGEQAAAQFANAEAIRYFSRALELTPEQDLSGRHDLLLSREKVFDLLGEREAQMQDLVALESLADTLADGGPQAGIRQSEIKLRQTNYAEATGEYARAVAAAMAAIETAQAAAGLARSAQIEQAHLEAARLEAEGYLQLGRVLWRQGDYEASRTPLQQALELAQASQLPQVEADSLRTLGIASADQGDYAAAKEHLEQALRICRRIGDRRGESAALNTLGIITDDQGDPVGAKTYYEQALGISQEIGDRRGESITLNNLGTISVELGDYAAAQTYYEQTLLICLEIDAPLGQSMTLNNLGIVSLYLGDYDDAQARFEQALRICRNIGSRRDEGIVLSNLGLLSHHQDDQEAAREYCQLALLITEELGDRPTRAEVLTHLGHALTGLELLAEASEAYHEALEIRREMGELNQAMESLAGLARVSMQCKAARQAQTQVEQILNHLEDNTLDGTEEPMRVYLTCYHVLRMNQDSRATTLLRTAHHLLQERAERIGDERLRRSFLERVAAHREILDQYASEG